MLASPGERRELLKTLNKDKRVPAPGAEPLRLDRIRTCVEAMTRIRTVRSNGVPCAGFKGPPAQAPPGCRPWFELVPKRETATIVFGHWARLGLYLQDRFVGLDTGCVWGGALTAIRLEDREVFQEPSELA